MRTKRSQLLNFWLSASLVCLLAGCKKPSIPKEQAPPKPALGVLVNQITVLRSTAITIALSFELQNLGPEDLKDVNVVCGAVAESGTVAAADARTAYVVVPANGVKLVQDIVFGLPGDIARSVECRSLSARTLNGTLVD